MRIMHCLFGLNIGGIEVMVKQLALCGAKNEITSFILSFSKGSDQATTDKFSQLFKHTSITVSCLNKPFNKHRFKTIFDLRSQIRVFKPSMIVIHLEMLTPYLFLATLGLRIQCVQIIHNEKTEGDFFHRFVGKFFVKKYIFVSLKAYEQGVKAFHLSPNKAVVIRNGIDLTDYNKDHTIIVEPSFLFVGRLTKQKNPLGLIDLYDTFKRKVEGTNPIPLLYMIGDGELMSDCQQDIRIRGLNEHIIIMGNRSDIHKYYLQHSILLLPSFWEGLPLVVMEAMAASMACICYDVGGISEIIENGKEGLLITLGHHEEFIDAMINVVKDCSFRQNIQINAQRKAQLFSIDKTLSQYIELFKQLQGEQ